MFWAHGCAERENANILPLGLKQLAILGMVATSYLCQTGEAFRLELDAYGNQLK